MKGYKKSIKELTDMEQEMVIRAQEKYGDFFINANEAIILTHTFLGSLSSKQILFLMYLSHIRKHLILALFSAVRLHGNQAMMDLRQVLEGAVVASYCLEHIKSIDDNEKVLDSLKNSKDINPWFESSFPIYSKMIKDNKKIINNNVAHVNILYSSQNFSFNSEQNKFETDFFDEDDEYAVKVNLWQVGNIALTILDLFSSVNKKLNLIQFREGFHLEHKKLALKNIQLQQELKNNERYLKRDRP